MVGGVLSILIRLLATGEIFPALSTALIYTFPFLSFVNYFVIYLLLAELP